jgi:hypothetical protein
MISGPSSGAELCAIGSSEIQSGASRARLVLVDHDANSISDAESLRTRAMYIVPVVSVITRRFQISAWRPLRCHPWSGDTAGGAGEPVTPSDAS